MTPWIIGKAIVLLGFLLYFEKIGQPRGRLAVKSILSLLFVVTVFLQPNAQTLFGRLLAAGLVLCLWGDVFLALPGLKWFRAGLVAFLLGHLLYVAAFTRLAPGADWISFGALVILAASGGAYLWLRPHLGEMHIPVAAYILVITVMLFGALAVYRQTGLAFSGKTMIFLGATLFYLSDLFVARDQFVKKEFSNRLIGLPLYYGGQFLLAFSPAYLMNN
ncbi:MAG: lysoplasmalogenase [Deltaproteobacteria bacterium]|nr:lysoplasmalogenase [Deltaproteobacteria bacterium]